MEDGKGLGLGEAPRVQEQRPGAGWLWEGDMPALIHRRLNGALQSEPRGVQVP